MSTEQRPPAHRTLHSTKAVAGGWCLALLLGAGWGCSGRANRSALVPDLGPTYDGACRRGERGARGGIAANQLGAIRFGAVPWPCSTSIVDRDGVRAHYDVQYRGCVADGRSARFASCYNATMAAEIRDRGFEGFTCR